jgi:hypothetical protein
MWEVKVCFDWAGNVEMMIYLSIFHNKCDVTQSTAMPETFGK